MSFGFGFSLPAYEGYAAGFGATSFGSGTTLALDFLNGNNTLDPRITFSRTTNVTLTDSAGLVANAPMNLLTFSEQFDNAAWTKTRATVTANAIAAPDGNLTADKLVENTDTNSHFINQNATVSSGIAITYSIYAKKGERNYLSIFCLGTTAASNTFFDLSTGVVVSTSANATSSIQNIGNGWYRCTVTATTNATTTGIYPGISVDGVNASYTGNGTSGIYLWGAQLELGSTATTYNPTTVKNLLGFTENFDNAAWTKSNAFVQTNLLTYSQDFGNGVWSKGTGASVAANNAVAPDGSATADTVTFTAGGASEFLRQSVTATAGLTYTISVYARSVSGNTAMSLDLGNAISNGFTLTTSWTRYTWTVTPGTTYTWLDIQMGGAAVVEFWGAQLVQGTSAGDYKATYAAAAAVGYTDIYGQPFAQKLVENTVNTQHYTSQSQALAWPTGSRVVGVVYCKAAERRYARVLIGGSTTGWNAYCAFDLQTGTAGSPSANSATATASITDIGGGWYRCAVLASPTVSSTTTALLQVNINNSLNPNDDSYTGDGTSGIYIFGAQLSDSASVDPYVYQPVAAPSSVAYYGPRFDYDPVTLAPKGLLIEEQRTNLLTYSEQFDNAAWTKVNATVTANTAVSPDGTADADLITVTGASGRAVGSYTFTAAAHTFSVFLKYSSQTDTLLRIVDGTNTFTLTLSWSGGVPAFVSNTGSGYAITPAGNGWYRASLTATTLAAAGTVQLYANGFGSSGTALVYGAQLEAGAFATSYIPTVASQVTRAADSASIIGNNFARWYNQTEGTVYAEGDSAATPNSVTTGFVDSTIVCINDATANNSIAVMRGDAGSQLSRFNVLAGGVSQANIKQASWAGNAFGKIAGAYKANDFAMSFNGATASTDTAGTIPVVTQMQIGGFTSSAGNLDGHIKRIAYYNRRLSNTELQGITS